MRNTRSKRNKRENFNFSESIRNHPVRWVLLLVLLVLVVLGIVACIHVKPPEMENPEDLPGDISAEEEEGEVLKITGANRKPGWYTFLVCGADQAASNTDTIIVGAYDSVAGSVNMVSIPRDTLVNTTWKVRKINSAYALGGIDSLNKELKKILGFVPDCYAVVDVEAFKELIDCIGGVTFDVPQDMHYVDPDQNLNIHLSAGVQTLNGYDAMCVMRYRSGYATADIGRISTQQEFIKAFAKQCLTLGNVTKVKEFAEIFKKDVETDMSLGNIVWYGKEFLTLDMENINFREFPADPGLMVGGLSYVGIYVNQWVDTINAYLNPYDKDISAGNLNILTKDGNSFYSTSGVIAGAKPTVGGSEKNTGAAKDLEPKKPSSEEPEETVSPVQDPGTENPPEWLGGEGGEGENTPGGQTPAAPPEEPATPQTPPEEPAAPQSPPENPPAASEDPASPVEGTEGEGQ